MKKIFLFCFAAVFLTSVSVSAKDLERWRCGSKIIELGAESFKVIENCGEPNSKENVGTSGRKHQVDIEKWVYGPIGGYMYILYFKAGNLSKIESVKES